MPRKRLTQLFPALIPLRQAQRRLFCLVGMRLDRRRYAGTQWGAVLPQRVFADSSPLLNPDTGFDLRYQWNKVHNIQLAVDKLDRLLIRPGETFSFCWAVRDADKVTPYKDGLIVVDGKLTTAPGGGLCHLTNLLFWLFLHSPLTIVERSGHREKDFPDPGDQPAGTDATRRTGGRRWSTRSATGTCGTTARGRLSTRRWMSSSGGSPALPGNCWGRPPSTTTAAASATPFRRG